MASQDPGLQRPDPKLFSGDDDEEDLFWKRKLEALINGDVTPSQAARLQFVRRRGGHYTPRRAPQTA